ncbi:MAG: alpha/beta hydrolase [Solobacterium sp.]|nr:alpha/beta hydrolase [Solobacterium sp.]
MKRIYASLLLAVMVLTCSGCNTKESDSPDDSAKHTADQVTDDLSDEGETEMHTEEHSYRTEEILCRNGNNQIYGFAYIPDAGKEKYPLVIFSHELGNDHTSGERYAQRLAEAGYAAYVFDFCGGTVGGNQSDGQNNEMSVLTEASDLETVLETSKTWDFVDADGIFLLGGSMGGLVTTVVGSGHQEEIAGMILMYPALSAKEDSGIEKYASKDDVPEDVSLFGGWIHVGRNFVLDLWDIDFYKMLASYKGHVLLMHGDQDGTVPVSYSEKAAEVISDCEFYVIRNGGHEFFGQPFEDAMSHILPYLENRMNELHTENVEEEMNMQMKIEETVVEVKWEENESVDALREMVKDHPLTVQMSMYGGFEQVGPIGASLPRNDVQTVTEPGDIVLYSGNQIVVFYGSNSWAYTRLGKITDKTDSEMRELLGNGDVTLTFSMN